MGGRLDRLTGFADWDLSEITHGVGGVVGNCGTDGWRSADVYDYSLERAVAAEFGDDRADMLARIQSHPETVQYRADVASCVQGKGVDYVAQLTVDDYFETVLNQAGLGWQDMADPFEGMDTTDFTDDDFDRVVEESGGSRLTDEQLNALAEIQAFEVAVAVATHECGGTWLQERQALAHLRTQIEDEFFRANADRLATFAATSTEG